VFSNSSSDARCCLTRSSAWVAIDPEWRRRRIGSGVKDMLLSGAVGGEGERSNAKSRQGGKGRVGIYV